MYAAFPSAGLFKPSLWPQNQVNTLSIQSSLSQALWAIKLYRPCFTMSIGGSEAVFDLPPEIALLKARNPGSKRTISSSAQYY